MNEIIDSVENSFDQPKLIPSVWKRFSVLFKTRVVGLLLMASIGGAVLATFMVSLTVAPVPSSGVMTLAPALDTVGIPLSGLSILLGVDRIPDMFRSTTNLLGQVTAAVAIDSWAGQDTDPYQEDDYGLLDAAGDQGVGRP